MFQSSWRSITLVTTSQIKAYSPSRASFNGTGTSADEALDCLGNESIEPAPKLGQRYNRARNGRPIPMPRTSPTISA